jgi:hypothetical protein
MMLMLMVVIADMTILVKHLLLLSHFCFLIKKNVRFFYPIDDDDDDDIKGEERGSRHTNRCIFKLTQDSLEN